MKLGQSTPLGGRKPYVLELEDIELAKKMAESGLCAPTIAKAFGVDTETVYNLMDRDAAFFGAIKKGHIKHYLKCDALLNDGELTPTACIYFSRTKWRGFYPQEVKGEEVAKMPKITVEFVNPKDVKAELEKEKLKITG